MGHCVLRATPQVGPVLWDVPEPVRAAVAYGGHPELPMKGRGWGRTKAVKPGPRVSSHPEALREKHWISRHPPLMRAIC